jgi:hypothetical protein
MLQPHGNLLHFTVFGPPSPFLRVGFPRAFGGACAVTQHGESLFGELKGVNLEEYLAYKMQHMK